MKCVRYAAFFMVCLLVCSSAWAIPGIKRASEEPQPAASMSAVTITESSESEASVKYVTYEEISEILSKGGWVLGGEKLEKVQAGVDAIQATNDEQNAEIARQEQEIKDLKDLIKKETGTKYFADLGAAFGFKADKLQYGIVADMGLRFGKGLMVKTGVQYMVADVGRIELPKFDSLEPMTLNVTVGWEW